MYCSEHIVAQVCIFKNACRKLIFHIHFERMHLLTLHEWIGVTTCGTNSRNWMLIIEAFHSTLHTQFECIFFCWCKAIQSSVWKIIQGVINLLLSRWRRTVNDTCSLEHAVRTSFSSVRDWNRVNLNTANVKNENCKKIPPSKFFEILRIEATGGSAIILFLAHSIFACHW